MVDDKTGVDNFEEFSWLEKKIVPKLAEVLGKDAGKLRCEIKVPTDGFFISSIFMVDLISCCGCETEDEIHSFVVKAQPTDENTRTFMRTDNFFHNEIIFYERLAKNYNNYPKCIYIAPEPVEKATIVLENVTQFGYKAVPPKELPGMKHALTAVREIGRFHARGYVMKEKNSEEFFGVAKELRRIYDTVHPVSVNYYNTVSLRPVNYLRSVNYDPEFCDKISVYLGNAHEKIFKDCMQPRNELAVLCHGDFTMNNVLFKEEDDGEFKAMLIDFARIGYTSPAIDMSTFLYVSCSAEVRENFSVIFRAYHKAIMDCLEEHGVQDLEKYSYDAFLKDYKRHAIFGCAIAIWFTPILCFRQKADFGDVMEDKSKYLKLMLEIGGDEVSKKVADMLLELKDNGCLDHMM